MYSQDLVVRSGAGEGRGTELRREILGDGLIGSLMCPESLQIQVQRSSNLTANIVR